MARFIQVEAGPGSGFGETECFYLNCESVAAVMPQAVSQDPLSYAVQVFIDSPAGQHIFLSETYDSFEAACEAVAAFADRLERCRG